MMQPPTIEFLTFALTVVTLVGSWIYYFSKIGVTLELIQKEIKEMSDEIKQSKNDREHTKIDVARLVEGLHTAKTRLDVLEAKWETYRK
jgi:hypothetical protein